MSFQHTFLITIGIDSASKKDLRNPLNFLMAWKTISRRSSPLLNKKWNYIIKILLELKDPEILSLLETNSISVKT